ncbi:MBL fold metallo-hydrolase [Priestia aryabhattai]|uniref:MBL fold metallo-hydrolase n=1 Tax=Priestia aryabhattai TaxID=412384 RepID=UPI0018747C56|nr:MBL fold metallo-hydrolase [Priestia aryabhattai]MBE5101611.1 MBL fold metallo-hydrolase [Priestia aryabhattai]
MNMKQISEHVFQCEFELDLSIRMPIHTWLIKDDEDVYIIDTGIEKFADDLIKAVLSIGTPKAILITHGHHDHIEGAAKLVEKFNIPIYAHQKELIYINGEAPYPKKDELENTGVAHIVQPLTEQTIAYLPIQYYLTSGHSPGHVVYHHEIDRVLLSGDLFITSQEDLYPPIRKFSVDMNENIDSGAIIDEIKPTLICSSHGQSLFYNDQLYKKYVWNYRD